jgi:hypothetical protein
MNHQPAKEDIQAAAQEVLPETESGDTTQRIADLDVMAAMVDALTTP